MVTGLLAEKREGIEWMIMVQDVIDVSPTRETARVVRPPFTVAAVRYAKVKGQAAYPRLRRMIRNLELAFRRFELDRSIALSLGLTSYISLDQLILAWEMNERTLLEGSLGPTAMAAFNALMEGKTWDDLRAELWQTDSGGSVAMGYRFNISGRWADPEETLEDRKEYGTEASPDLDTHCSRTVPEATAAGIE